MNEGSIKMLPITIEPEAYEFLKEMAAFKNLSVHELASQIVMNQLEIWVDKIGFSN